MNPVVHFELPADDQDRMTDFYAKTFGWQNEKLGPEMNEYILTSTTENGENGMPKNPGVINGGFYEKTEGMPNKPSIVISVDNIHSSIKMVNENGGKVLGEPNEMPGVGQFVYFEDTEGNISGMLQPENVP